jgi:16S rRNA (cytidine1402-2'-O)-methyltransferase
MIPARAMERAEGELWIVATPIGTLEDLSARARRLLEEVDLILAEDTRRVRKLLSAAEIRSGRRLRCLRDHNEAEVTDEYVNALRRGLRIALVSDAGTPVLSDPGYLLVQKARAAGIAVRSAPGPSVFTAALAAAGQPPLPAMLVGFLPPRAGARRRLVGELTDLPCSLVVLLSPHRLGAELEALAVGLGQNRAATLLAELSKAHERAVHGSLGRLATSAEVTAPRGEYVIVIGPPDPSHRAAPQRSRDEVLAAYELALATGVDQRAARREVARRLGLSRSEVYRALIRAGCEE